MPREYHHRSHDQQCSQSIQIHTIQNTTMLTSMEDRSFEMQHLSRTSDSLFTGASINYNYKKDRFDFLSPKSKKESIETKRWVAIKINAIHLHQHHRSWTTTSSIIGDKEESIEIKNRVQLTNIESFLQFSVRRRLSAPSQSSLEDYRRSKYRRIQPDSSRSLLFYGWCLFWFLVFRRKLGWCRSRSVLKW